MQNRLDGAAEAQAVSEKQLAELHSAIAAERAARPESVSKVNFIQPEAFSRPSNLDTLFSFFFLTCRLYCRINAARHLVDWLLRGKR
jgi:hypothetical protein